MAFLARALGQGHDWSAESPSPQLSISSLSVIANALSTAAESKPLVVMASASYPAPRSKAGTLKALLKSDVGNPLASERRALSAALTTLTVGLGELERTFGSTVSPVAPV